MKKEVKMDFKTLRRKAGYTQEQIALIMGVSRVTVSNWERGKIKPYVQKELLKIYGHSSK